jgi:hypothetical protein
MVFINKRILNKFRSMNNTIQITKKFIINTDVNFPFRDEINQIANKITNQEYESDSITDIISWSQLRKNNLNLYNKILRNIHRETEYYINKVDIIPWLTDKFELHSFKYSTFFYTISNPDIRNRNEHVFILYLVSDDLLLLDVIDNHLIISMKLNEDDSHKTCMIKIDDSISISKYK